MKKLLPISLLVMCFAVIAEERASAWINSRFGIGFNWGWQSGGNNLLWGLFRDGQPCGADFYHVEVPVYPRSGGCGSYGGGGYPGGYPGVAPGGYPGVAPGAPIPGVPAAGLGFGGGFGPGFGPVPPVAPVSNNGSLFGGHEHAIQAPTAPATSSGAQPVSFYRQSNYGHYYPTYRYYR